MFNQTKHFFMEIINTFKQSIAILCLNLFKINTVLILILQNKKDEDIYTMYLDRVKLYLFLSSVVDRGFEPRSGQTKDYKIGICCFAAKNTALSVGYLSVQTIFVRGEGFWRLTPLSTICHDGHFISGGNRSTWRKPQTCYKSATNFITLYIHNFLIEQQNIKERLVP
jgi:hypothetical protein